MIAAVKPNITAIPILSFIAPIPAIIQPIIAASRVATTDHITTCFIIIKKPHLFLKMRSDHSEKNGEKQYLVVYFCPKIQE